MVGGRWRNYFGQAAATLLVTGRCCLRRCDIVEGKVQVKNLPVQGTIQLTAKVAEGDFLEAGWRRIKESSPFPARPSAAPGRKPAGLQLCPPDAVARWQADSHRFPPYQYRAENCVTNAKGDMRVPSTREREVILLRITLVVACLRERKEAKNITIAACVH